MSFNNNDGNEELDFPKLLLILRVLTPLRAATYSIELLIINDIYADLCIDYPLNPRLAHGT